MSWLPAELNVHDSRLHYIRREPGRFTSTTVDTVARRATQSHILQRSHVARPLPRGPLHDLQASSSNPTNCKVEDCGLTSTGCAHAPPQPTEVSKEQPHAVTPPPHFHAQSGCPPAFVTHRHDEGGRPFQEKHRQGPAPHSSCVCSHPTGAAARQSTRPGEREHAVSIAQQHNLAASSPSWPIQTPQNSRLAPGQTQARP